MEFIDIHLSSIMTFIGPLVGIVIGSLIASKGQNKLFKEQLNAENRKLKREKHLKTLYIYNKFLEANGRTSIAGNFDPPVFQYELYMEEIRGILYEDLSCLDKDVYELVREIDYALNQMKGTSDDVKMHEYMYGLYLNIYSTIEEHFYKKEFYL